MADPQQANAPAPGSAPVSDDWEAAFQAEDYLFSPEEGGASAKPSTATQKPADGDTAGAAIPPQRPVAGFFVRLGQAGWARRATTLLPPGPARMLADPGRRGMVICGVFLLLLLLAVSVILLPGGAGEPEIGEPEIGEPEIDEPEQPAGTVAPPVREKAPEVGALPLTDEPKAAAKTPLFSHETQAGRRKWRLAPFMIQVVDPEHRENPVYVVVDLSLSLRLTGDDTLPVEEQYLVRESIYQFYRNRPLYELRRFALARGEMKSKLQAWLRKQWPAGPIDTLFFHRYTIR